MECRAMEARTHGRNQEPHFEGGDTMFELTRRQTVAATVACGLAAVLTGGSAVAEDDKQLTTPAQILKDKVEGPVRVELTVEDWVRYRGATAGPGEPQTLILKGGRLGDDRLDVVVDQKVFARLAALGITDPKEHFIGKTVVVNGKINRNPAPLGGTSIVLWLNGLDQIES